MKTLGIIGGVGPGSTIDYYGSIIAQYRKLKGDGSYPQLLINSIDLKKEIDLVAANDLRGTADFLVDEIKKLALAGADFGLIASNTPHIVFDDVQRQSPIPLISIVEATAKVAKEMNLKRVGLMGTKFTMGASFYPDTFSKYGINVVVPPASDQQFIHDKYMNELLNGIFLPETHASLTAIIDKLKRTQNVEGVILGGTELPLILRKPEHHGIPILNTTRIHVEAAVAEMLS
jgi:aspartate racemase